MPRGDGGFNVGEKSRLRGHDRSECDRSDAILIEIERDRLVRLLHGRIQLYQFRRENTHRGQLILDLLKGRKHGLTIIGYALNIAGLGGL